MENQGGVHQRPCRGFPVVEQRGQRDVGFRGLGSAVVSIEERPYLNGFETVCPAVPEEWKQGVNLVPAGGSAGEDVGKNVGPAVGLRPPADGATAFVRPKQGEQDACRLLGILDRDVRAPKPGPSLLIVVGDVGPKPRRALCLDLVIREPEVWRHKTKLPIWCALQAARGEKKVSFCRSLRQYNKGRTDSVVGAGSPPGGVPRW